MVTGEILALLFCLESVDMDLRTAKIDNEWILSGVVMAFLYQMVSPDPRRLPGIIIPFLALFPFYWFRMIGAGDIKLLCVLGMFMGPRKIVLCMMWTFVLAGILSLAILIDDGSLAERLAYFRWYVKETAVRMSSMTNMVITDRVGTEIVDCAESGRADKGHGGTSGNRGRVRPYMRKGYHRESLHMAVPVMAAVLLWYGGVY